MFLLGSTCRCCERAGLDYDSYIDDLEVRQALSVIKDRIDHQKAMEAAAEAAEEAEAEAAAVAQVGTGQGNCSSGLLESAKECVRIRVGMA
eukprot:4046964-Pleurochrysis_carterae.AAC.1